MSPRTADRTPNPAAAALAGTRGAGVGGAPRDPRCRWARLGGQARGRGRRGRASTPRAIPAPNQCQASIREDLLEG